MAARDVPSAVETILDGGGIRRPIFLAELRFASETVRLWTGYGSLSYDGQTWLGAGDLGAIQPIEETTALEAKGMSFTLNGLSAENIALVLTEKYQGREVYLYFGFMDGAGAVSGVVGPWVYLMDKAKIEEGPQTSAVTLLTENRLKIFDKASNRTTAAADQAIEYPADLGYEFLAGLQDKEIVW